MEERKLRQIIANNLRTLQHLRGLTVRELSAKSGVSKATINRILSFEAQQDIKLDILSKLTKALKCHPSAILIEHATTESLVNADIHKSIEQLYSCRADTQKKLSGLISDLHLLDTLRNK